MASLWQQAGRAGRREQPSVSIYIGFDGPLDQYFMHQPENLFKRPIETAQVTATSAHLQSHECHHAPYAVGLKMQDVICMLPFALGMLLTCTEISAMSEKLCAWVGTDRPGE